MTVYATDYKKPDFAVKKVKLEFDLNADRTVVFSRLECVKRNPKAQTLWMDGEGLDLLELRIDGETASRNRYQLSQGGLCIDAPPDRCIIEAKTALCPAKNTRCEGLYQSGKHLVTQCEAEGFRRITFFPDRPDILSLYDVALRADPELYPVLLSNGNEIERQTLPDGRVMCHFRDPWPKPCYLFALVAADMACETARFTTRSGRSVLLSVYAERGLQQRTLFALSVLQDAMRWDEQQYEREYDLETLNIVAVDEFNAGAMENKGLNIFNSACILADPQTATDADYERIEAVIAHEYFHNWTGNRITCRDWFQLSLKEGLTVFREQQFMESRRSATVQRIKQARFMRLVQFPEDESPLAHSVRPESYVKIDNFYTATVYEKGAEILRMLRFIGGAKEWLRGMKQYFTENDGKAVTCEDFIRAHEVANNRDYSLFRLWYDQAGTPRIKVSIKRNGEILELRLTQYTPPTPGQPEKRPLLVPLRFSFLEGATGAELKLEALDDTDDTVERLEGDWKITLSQPRSVFRFRLRDTPKNIILSVNRGFTAPVLIEGNDASEKILMQYDSDLFNRWNAGQDFAARLIRDDDSRNKETFVEIWKRRLVDEAGDPETRAWLLMLPDYETVSALMNPIDYQIIERRTNALADCLASEVAGELNAMYEGLHPSAEPSPVCAAMRQLKNTLLQFLWHIDPQKAVSQYWQAENMTESLAALALLARGPEGDGPLQDFYLKWRNDPVLIDKWFSLQAKAPREDALQRVKALVRHPDFSLSKPNKVYALIRGFSAGNPAQFYKKDEASYQFLAEIIIELQSLNPQIAARLVAPLGKWRRFSAEQGIAMKSALRSILDSKTLAREVREVVQKTLFEQATPQNTA